MELVREKQTKGQAAPSQNYHDYPIRTGKIRGIDNKIKAIKRNAYAIRNPSHCN
jgi:transposase